MLALAGDAAIWAFVRSVRGTLLRWERVFALPIFNIINVPLQALVIRYQQIFGSSISVIFRMVLLA